MSVIGNGEFSSIFIRSWSVTRDTEKQTNQKYSIMFKNAREGSNATEAAVSLCEKGLLAPCSEVPLCYAHWGHEHHRAESCGCQDEGRQEAKAEEEAEVATDREEKSRETLRANKMSSAMSQQGQKK